MADESYLKQQEAFPLLTVEQQSLLLSVCGSNDANLCELGRILQQEIFSRGDSIYTSAVDPEQRSYLRQLLQLLVKYVSNGVVPRKILLRSLVDSVDFVPGEPLTFTIAGRKFTLRSPGQQHYLQKIRTHQLTFALGPAGTGKTYLAVAAALQQLLNRQKNCLILTRPVLEAGEHLGFLPGSYLDKIDPYLQPLYDSVIDLIGPERFAKLRQNNQIEISPLAYMRGRTLNRAFIILDEAQNSSKQQMKLFLTRLGEDTATVVTGDPSQIDLKNTDDSGLHDAVQKLSAIEKIAVHYFDERDIVRSDLVREIVRAYDEPPNNTAAL